MFFGADTSISTDCLNDLKAQQVIDEMVLMNNATGELAWDSVWKNIASDGDMGINKRIGEVLGPEADYTCYMEKL